MPDRTRSFSDATKLAGRPRAAATRPRPSSMVQRTPSTASQSRIAFSSIASKTGVRLLGDELMMTNTSAVAVCCCSASRSSLSSRAFSMAMTAWGGKRGRQFDLLVGEGKHFGDDG